MRNSWPWRQAQSNFQYLPFVSEGPDSHAETVDVIKQIAGNGRRVTPMIAGVKAFARPLRALSDGTGVRSARSEAGNVRLIRPLYDLHSISLPSVPFFRQILVDGRNFYHDFHRSIRHTLATESRLQRRDGRFV
jgi:hypothetical protein